MPTDLENYYYERIKCLEQELIKARALIGELIDEIQSLTGPSINEHGTN